MVRKFKFFHGIVGPRLTAVWSPQLQEDLQEGHGLDIESELTRLMSEQIAEEIDNEIIDTLTRRINGGNTDWGYIRRWMEIGDQRA
jgi:hypothetical protein